MLDKCPAIVPFVEDHRNILILAPTAPLDLEAMATLQAALKRGIEMTFQIEESELVASLCPNRMNARLFCFTEAAEGGAGVLTRLATEPQAMARSCRRCSACDALQRPRGPWLVDDLPALEQKTSDRHSICEAGVTSACCHISTSQTDHINRRNSQAIEMLVALANAR